MNYFCDSKDFGKTLDSCVKDTQKKIRNAAYKTLESVAERSRRAVLANYFKKFPDENGIKKWSIFTANTDSNTKGMLNNIWVQLQSTNIEGAYSALVATKTTVLQSSGVSVKAGLIGDA